MNQCKGRIKDIMRQIKAYLIPVKSTGTIGMYQHLIAASIWIEVGSFCAAIMLCALGNGNKWTSLCENIAIGIFCSTILVLMTACIQFISERNKTFSFFCENTVLFLAWLVDAVDRKDTMTEKQCETEYNNILNTLEKNHIDTDFTLFWFSVKNNDYYLEACNNIIRLRLPFLISRNHVEVIRSISREDLKKTVKSMMKMTEKYYTTEFNIFREIWETITEER